MGQMSQSAWNNEAKRFMVGRELAFGGKSHVNTSVLIAVCVPVVVPR